MPTDNTRQISLNRYKGTEAQAQTIIKLAEAEFESLKGKIVLVSHAEVFSDAEESAGDEEGFARFDPPVPVPMTVRDLEIVEEDWIDEGLYPCLILSWDDYPQDRFYSVGRLIRADGSRRDGAEWEYIEEEEKA